MAAMKCGGLRPQVATINQAPIRQTGSGHDASSSSTIITLCAATINQAPIRQTRSGHDASSSSNYNSMPGTQTAAR